MVAALFLSFFGLDSVDCRNAFLGKRSAVSMNSPARCAEFNCANIVGNATLIFGYMVAVNNILAIALILSVYMYIYSNNDSIAKTSVM